MSASDIVIDVSNMSLNGDLGLASFNASGITLDIDSGLTFSLEAAQPLASEATPTVTFGLEDDNSALGTEIDIADIVFGAEIQIN